ncbi:kinase-like domain-containing protein, partial [Gigaspora rosea]
EKLQLLSYIAFDLKIIHSHGIIHRDLHSGNILQNKLYNAYIGDLGLAEAVDKVLAKSNGIYGVFPYIAPEVLRNRGNTPASDVYSFGIIMWEVSSGRLAFSDKNHDFGFLTEVCNGLRPTVAKDMPEYYVDLMKGCWDSDPEKRSMASEIYEVIK